MEGTGGAFSASGHQDRGELGRHVPTLTAIVTAHGETPYGIITNLEEQSRRPDQILVATSNWWPLEPAFVNNSNMTVYRRSGAKVYLELHEDKEDYGYDKRNRLLKMATSQYVGFFNHDDSYELNYIERMMNALAETDADIAYCDWDEPNKAMIDGFRVLDKCKFRAFESTLGNFIVRTSMIQSIGGFPVNATSSLISSAALAAAAAARQGLEINMGATTLGWTDGLLITALGEMTSKIVHVEGVLYHHNRPYWNDIRPMVWGVAEGEAKGS